MFGALVRAQVCVHTYSTFMTVASGDERRTGVSPGEAAHHCSAQGRRISLANIIGKCTKEVLSGTDTHRALGKKTRKLSYRRSDSLSACLGWTAASDRLQIILL